MNKFLANLRLFSIDLRSLAAFRIGLAVLLLLDLLQRAGNLATFYSYDGILPLAEIPDHVLARLTPSWLTVHGLSDAVWFQGILFFASAIFAACLLVGFHTRIAAVASWFMLMSLQARNPFVLNGGDALLRVLVFWSMFLPLGAVASIDARRRNRPTQLNTTSLATVALLLQVAMMYWFSSLHKRHDFWVADFSATYYALNLGYLVRPLGIWLLEFPQLLSLLTAATFWLEFLAPVLVFCPLGTAYLRSGILGLFVLFHLGLAVTLDVGLFSYIAMVAWLPFLPAKFWEWTQPLARRCCDRLVAAWPSSASGPRTPVSSAKAPSARDVVELGPLGNVVAGSLLVFVILWNVRGLDYKFWEPKILPQQLNPIAKLSGLGQSWAMFAPRPSREDGWLVMKGTLANGDVVNLWEQGEFLPQSSRPDVASYQGWRWRRFLIDLKSPKLAWCRKRFAQWLGQRWNRQHAVGHPEQRVRAVEIYWVSHIVQRPGERAQDLKTVKLFPSRQRKTDPPTRQLANTIQK